MPIREFTGFGGVKIVADVYGQEEHPCVLLLPGGTQSRRVRGSCSGIGAIILAAFALLFGQISPLAFRVSSAALRSH